MKKIGILLAILLIAGVCAMADDAVPVVQGAVLFTDIDAVALSQAEMAVVDGGYDPDAGGNNWHYNRRDIEETAAYLDQRSKITVSVSVKAEYKSPSFSFGYDVQPKIGPFVQVSAGPFSIKFRNERR